MTTDLVFPGHVRWRTSQRHISEDDVDHVVRMLMTYCTGTTGGLSTRACLTMGANYGS
jgi:hypothetical protein